MINSKVLAVLVGIFFLSFGKCLALAPEFEQKIYGLKWICYSPTNYNPETNLFPSPQSLEDDLVLLIKAGFNGLITYGSQSILGDIPQIAKRVGFEGVIMGVWDIRDAGEMENAIGAAKYVDGYCLGNEGMFKRYELEELKFAIDNVKEKTGKPATTTEEITDYAKDTVMNVGDWIFPNVHPYFFNVKDPGQAVRWTEKYYLVIGRSAERVGKLVFFKEVGLPTAGDQLAGSANQQRFFELLEKTNIKFAYFEAYDQPWKDFKPVEPHWGLFDRNRHPKRYISGKLKTSIDEN